MTTPYQQTFLPIDAMPLPALRDPVLTDQRPGAFDAAEATYRDLALGFATARDDVHRALATAQAAHFGAAADAASGHLRALVEPGDAAAREANRAAEALREQNGYAARVHREMALADEGYTLPGSVATAAGYLDPLLEKAVRTYTDADAAELAAAHTRARDELHLYQTNTNDNLSSGFAPFAPPAEPASGDGSPPAGDGTAPPLDGVAPAATSPAATSDPGRTGPAGTSGPTSPGPTNPSPTNPGTGHAGPNNAGAGHGSHGGADPSPIYPGGSSSGRPTPSMSVPDRHGPPQLPTGPTRPRVDVPLLPPGRPFPRPPSGIQPPHEPGRAPFRTPGGIPAQQPEHVGARASTGVPEPGPVRGGAAQRPIVGTPFLPAGSARSDDRVHQRPPWLLEDDPASIWFAGMPAYIDPVIGVDTPP